MGGAFSRSGVIRARLPVMGQKVIGLVGPMVSGKGIVADYLVSLGYSYFRLSDIIREEIERLGKTPDRKTLQDIGDKLRQKYGTDILAKRVAKKIESSRIERAIVDGVRNPGELKYLRRRFGAIIIGVDATRERRFQFILERDRSGDPKTWEEFCQLEQRDLAWVKKLLVNRWLLVLNSLILLSRTTAQKRNFWQRFVIKSPHEPGL